MSGKLYLKSQRRPRPFSSDLALRQLLMKDGTMRMRHFLVRVCFLTLVTIAIVVPLAILIHNKVTGVQPDYCARSSGPCLTIAQGTFTGTLGEENLAQPVEVFLGIPYALSPADEARFKPPVKVSSSTKIFDATKYGNICIDSSAATVDRSEDCLSLNVFRQQSQVVLNNLPVVVYIHGGSFNFGSGASRDMAGLIAASSKPLVGVSINYRLGALGFLPSGLTAKEGILNLGLKDQIMALEWVRDNIQAFGGDPNKVTIMGDSAGAHSVGHHLQNVNGPVLFHQAIIESGAPTARSCRPYAAALNEQQFRNFTDATGASGLPDDQVMDYLRSLPVSEIKAASTKIYNYYAPSIRWPFQPTIDGPGGLIPEAPLTLWEKGEWVKVPILTGFCTDEGAPFVDRGMNTSQEFTEFWQTLIPDLSSSDLDEMENLYPDPLANSKSPYADTRKGVGREYKRVTAAYGQFAYIGPVRHTSHFAGTEGNPPVYLYHFAVNSSVVLGTSHDGASLYITYSSRIRAISSHQKSIAAAVNDYWTSFIATGDPNTLKAKSSTRAEWPAYISEANNSTNTVLLIGSGNDERAGGKGVGPLTNSATDSFAVAESNFWWSKEMLSQD